MHRLYLNSHGSYRIAGPVVISAVFIQKPIENNYILHHYNKVRTIANWYDWDNLWVDLALEQLLKERAVLVLTDTISPNRFRSNYPTYTALRRKVDLLVGEFYRYGGRRPHCHYAGDILPATPREEGTRHGYPDMPLGCFLAMLYAQSEQRHIMQEVYHKRHRKYRFHEHYGRNSWNHILKLWRYGPQLKYHREEAIFYLGKYWYREYQKLSWWALTCDFPPKWWWRLYPDTPFLHFLPKEEQRQIDAFVFNTNYPKSFQHWMNTAGKPARQEYKPEYLNLKRKLKKKERLEERGLLRQTNKPEKLKRANLRYEEMRRWLRRKRVFYQFAYDYYCRRADRDAQSQTNR